LIYKSFNNFTSTFIAAVKDAPSSGTPETELDYGVLRISDGAAGSLINPTDGDYYLLTAFKRSGSVESNIEVMRVTGVNNATPGECRITVQRAQEGTSAKAFVAGDYLSLRITKGTAENFSQPADLATKEPIIAAPTSAPTEKYWRGDKTWRDFFTDVRAATLTGLSTATSAAIAATDTVLDALAKLQAQLGDKVDKVSGKGLSTEDYTTAEKTKLAGLSNTRPVSNLAVTYVNGQAAAVTEDGVTKSISYDAQGRVATVSYPYAGKTRTETYTYNTNGQMTGMTASDAL
jgi:YD repeat-containing protein